MIVHGPLPRENVAALYDAADVFVLPSVKEPYGTVYGEAMAAGLPVVGWRAGNLPYLMENGREGLLCDPGDVQGLARALERLVDDEPLRMPLAKLGFGSGRVVAGSGVPPEDVVDHLDVEPHGWAVLTV